LNKRAGITILLFSLTFISGIEHTNNLLFLVFGITIALVSLINFKYWRILLLVYCALYLVIVFPPLITLTVDYGFLNLLKSTTIGLFKDGVSISKVMNFWHLLIMPTLILLITLLMTWQIINLKR